MRIYEILFEARIYNQNYLDSIIHNYSIELPQKAKDFMKRIITKAAQDSINQTRPKLAPNATEWDRKDLANGTLVNFSTSNELRDKLDHIRDWLRHPQVTEQELNSLRGIQDIDIANEHADRFFARLNKKASSEEDESGLETIMTWPDGFRLVKLNTAQCLNREGKLMQHCVGSYADEIENGIEIFSLRDPQNNPHVTIEKNGNNIHQIKGKNNKAPIEKYHKYIRDYLNKNKFDEIRDLKNIGLIKVNDKIYELSNIPDNLTVNGSLDLSNTQITKLPDNLTVNGSLYLENTQIKELPETLTVNCSLYLTNTKIKELPENLTVNGSLYLGNTQITELPENLTVNGSLYLGNTQITELPENLTVNGYLDLSYTPITELPENLTVNGYLDLSYTPITKLPDTLKVMQVIYRSYDMIFEYIPDHLKNKIKVWK